MGALPAAPMAPLPAAAAPWDGGNAAGCKRIPTPPGDHAAPVLLAELISVERSMAGECQGMAVGKPAKGMSPEVSRV